MGLGDAAGQGWPQIADLALAFALSALIGLEREIRQKSAGLRTYTVVGFAAALIMLVSKYGFGDVLTGQTHLDPSRIAAQIVSGIGFIGGGVIFVKQDVVRGLTTAATVWLTAAIGMACGAGLPVLAVIVTVGNFIIVFGFPVIERHLPRSRWAPSLLHVSYRDGGGILRDIMVACTEHGFSVDRMKVERASDSETAEHKRIVTVELEVRGQHPVSQLAARLSDLDGVTGVHTRDAAVTPE